VAEGKKGGWFSHGRLREWRGEKGVRRLQGALFYWHTEVGDDWRGGAMWQARAGRERGGVSHPDRRAGPDRQRPEADGRGRRGTTMSCGRSEQGRPGR
jgi:hypothetical protein